MSIAVFTCWVLALCGPTVLEKGLRGREGVGVKGDHSPPARHPSAVTGALPNSAHLLTSALSPTLCEDS